MTLNQKLLKLRHKWIGKLSRKDAEFFFNLGTMKDTAIFSSLVELKSETFRDDFDLELKFCRYMQVLMCMSFASDDPRDKDLVDKYFWVPIMCEEISKGRSPKHLSDEVIDKMKEIPRSFSLHTLYDLGGGVTDDLLRNTPKKHLEMVNSILEYYSTPIAAFWTVMGNRPRDFDLLDELKTLTAYIRLKHFDKVAQPEGKVEAYIKGMEFVYSYKPPLRRAA